MDSNELRDLVVEALEDIKAEDIVCLDVQAQTEIADYMIVASGTSNRQLKALTDSVVEKSKASGVRPLGVEGEDSGEWVLVDLADIIVHIMLPTVREFYDLERLWSITPDRDGSRDEGSA